MILNSCLKIFLLNIFIQLVHGSVPVLLYSHKLVPKVQNYINTFSHLPFPPERVTEVTHRLLDACTSDAYVFVDQPGVTLDDLADYSQFKFLRTYAFISSTLGSIPRAETPLNYESLIEYVNKHCGPNISIVEINGFEELETYIDSQTRIIHIKFPDLPPISEYPELRQEYLKAADETLRNILRKLPSPDHTIIYSTSIGPEYLNKLNEKKYSQMGIFPDISKDPSRKKEFERNNKVIEEKHQLPEKRNNLLKNDQWKYSIGNFIDLEIIRENEVLAFFITLTAIIFIFKILFDLLGFLWGLVFKNTTTNIKKKKLEDTKKTK